ncbi:hypothetical protein [Paenibacillus naphthalenovorans]|uniref:hypothetical protein n=1 Tax=Paenibacillus naphthalenovorans TaxID=162209 RepID=UPI00094518C5|nr:hypothetical protein [Paenibacillus naphthalenovorans]
MDEMISMEREAESLITAEMVSDCSYCTMVSPDPLYKTPVYCTKYSGSCQPIQVNLAACLTCGEYKKTPIRLNL